MIFSAPTLSAEFLRVIERVDQLRSQLSYLLQSQPKRWTGLLRRSTFARAIQASNSIEGYDVTIDDAVAAVENEEPLNPKDEAWMAVVGYRVAMSYILQLAGDLYYTHNVGTLRSLHYMMIGYDLSKHPGRWRPGSIYVRQEPSGDIVYEGPDIDGVPALMNELIERLNLDDKVHPMVRAAMAHMNLVMIHPFSDGNGRMARALQTFVFAKGGILDPTFSSIEEYLGRNTPEYYKILGEVGQGSWHPENDATPWIKFCLTAHYRQAQTLLRRTKQLERLWNLLETEVKRRGLNERVILALSDAAYGYRVRNNTYRTAADVSEQVASRDLHALCEEGLLIPKGERRGRFYLAGEWLSRAKTSSLLPKITSDPFTDIPETRERPEQRGLFDEPSSAERPVKRRSTGW
jgi:Fic family protein